MSPELEKRIDQALENRDEKGFKNLSETDKVLVTIFELECEIGNGGFHQYYFNSAGDHAWYGPTALNKIGSRTMAKICAEANEIFGKDGPLEDRFARQDKLELIGEDSEKRLQELSKRFYKEAEKIKDLMLSYLSTRK